MIPLVEFFFGCIIFSNPRLMDPAFTASNVLELWSLMKGKVDWALQEGPTVVLQLIVKRLHEYHVQSMRKCHAECNGIDFQTWSGIMGTSIVDETARMVISVLIMEGAVLKRSYPRHIKGIGLFKTGELLVDALGRQAENGTVDESSEDEFIDGSDEEEELDQSPENGDSDDYEFW